MPSVFRHHIPRSFLMLGAAEAVLFLLSIFFGVWLHFGLYAGHVVSVESTFPEALLFAVVMVLAMTSRGCGRRI